MPGEIEGESEEKVANDPMEQSIGPWVEQLKNWLIAADDISHYIAPSSLAIGKVIPRLFYGLVNISDAIRPESESSKERDFASAMELFALCVVNAFLAEESAYHLPNDDSPEPIFLDNPRTSALDYLKRLNRVSTKFQKEKLPLTYIVATCPLITGLISQEKADNKWPFKLKGLNEQIFIDEDSWNKLKTISIAGKKEPTGTDEKSASSDNKKTQRSQRRPKTPTAKTSDPTSESSS